jgi:uncharacterized cupredoxin-like copper-binding protein
MSPSRELRLKGAVAFSAVAVLLAGCGGGGPNSSSTPPGGASTTAGGGVQTGPAGGSANAPGGTLHLKADPSGALRFNVKSLAARAGKVTLVMRNPSSLSHSVAIQGNGVNAAGQVVAQGGTSTASATLNPGTYTFYCTVPGHREAGMLGALTVK